MRAPEHSSVPSTGRPARPSSTCGRHSRRSLVGAHVLAGLLFGAAVSAAPAQAASFVVDSLLDTPDVNVGNGVCQDAGGNCTLRAALQEAAANGVPDTITFSVSGTIALTTVALPTISNSATTVDGTGQSIVIQGSSVFGTPGFVLTSSSNVLRLLTIRGFDSPGGRPILIDVGSTGNILDRLVVGPNQESGIRIRGNFNTVKGCLVGVAAGGTVAAPNGGGIVIEGGSNNQIGTGTPGEGNVVSGNFGHGIGMTDLSANNRVNGNIIGLNAAGTAALPNGASGVALVASGSLPNAGITGNVIGGVSAGEGNVISGNGANGVILIGTGITGNAIQGNVIGLASDGATAIPNGFAGVSISGGPSSNLIGGTVPGARNTISGHYGAGIGKGVYISDSTSSTNTISGNYIGTTTSGLVARPNSFGIWLSGAFFTQIGGGSAGSGNVASSNNVGIYLENVASATTILRNLIGVGADGTTPLGNVLGGVYLGNGVRNTDVGGLTPGDGNVIAYNGYGVKVDDVPGSQPVYNRILGNSIFDNAGNGSPIGIHLGNGLPPANDPCDADTGPNDQQNYPVVTSAVSVAGTTTVNGTLDSLPNTTFRIEVFATPTASPAGYGQGKVFLGTTNVTTGPGCTATWSLSAPGSYLTQTITATATSPAPTSSTSPFSADFTATPVELTGFTAD